MIKVNKTKSESIVSAFLYSLANPHEEFEVSTTGKAKNPLKVFEKLHKNKAGLVHGVFLRNNPPDFLVFFSDKFKNNIGAVLSSKLESDFKDFDEWRHEPIAWLKGNFFKDFKSIAEALEGQPSVTHNAEAEKLRKELDAAKAKLERLEKENASLKKKTEKKPRLNKG